MLQKYSPDVQMKDWKSPLQSSPFCSHVIPKILVFTKFASCNLAKLLHLKV